MTSFKQYFESKQLAGVEYLYSLSTTGEVEMLQLKPYSNMKGWLGEGVWTWFGESVPFSVQIHRGELTIDFFSTSYWGNHEDVVKWSGPLPSVVYRNIQNYTRGTPRQPVDFKAAMVELEAWLETPSVSRMVTKEVRDRISKGSFKSFSTVERARNWHEQI